MKTTAGKSQMSARAQPARRDVFVPDSDIPIAMMPHIVPSGSAGPRMMRESRVDSIPS